MYESPVADTLVLEYFRNILQFYVLNFFEQSLPFVEIFPFVGVVLVTMEGSGELY